MSYRAVASTPDVPLSGFPLAHGSDDLLAANIPARLITSGRLNRRPT
jgi:hypothetical protein